MEEKKRNEEFTKDIKDEKNQENVEKTESAKEQSKEECQQAIENKQNLNEVNKGKPTVQNVPNNEKMENDKNQVPKDVEESKKEEEKHKNDKEQKIHEPEIKKEESKNFDSTDNTVDAKSENKEDKSQGLVKPTLTDSIIPPVQIKNSEKGIEIKVNAATTSPESIEKPKAQLHEKEEKIAHIIDTCSGFGKLSAIEKQPENSSEPAANQKQTFFQKSTGGPGIMHNDDEDEYENENEEEEENEEEDEEDEDEIIHNKQLLNAPNVKSGIFGGAPLDNQTTGLFGTIKIEQDINLVQTKPLNIGSNGLRAKQYNKKVYFNMLASASNINFEFKKVIDPETYNDFLHILAQSEFSHSDKSIEEVRYEQVYKVFLIITHYSI